VVLNHGINSWGITKLIGHSPKTGPMVTISLFLNFDLELETVGGWEVDSLVTTWGISSDWLEPSVSGDMSEVVTVLVT